MSYFSGGWFSRNKAQETKPTNSSKSRWFGWGESDDYGRGTGFSFGTNFSFRKKEDEREIVKPGMAYWEKQDHNTFMRNSEVEFLEKAKIRYDLNDDQIIALRDKIHNFPKYLSYNLRNMYYHKPEVKKITNTEGKNHWQFKVIEQTDDYFMKGLTYNSDRNSGIVSKNIANNICLEMVLKNVQEDPEQYLQNMGGSGSGGDPKENDQGKSSNNNKGPSEKDMQKAMSRAMEDSKNEIDEAEELEEFFGDPDSMDDAPEGEGGRAAGSKTGKNLKDLEALKELKKQLGHIAISKAQLQQFIKTVEKMTTAYFSSVYKTEYESFLDSESQEEIENIEDMHPMFRKFNIEDLVEEERKYSFGFDVYLDSSGSMDSKCKMQGGGWLRAISLGKLCAYKLKQYGFVKKLFHFDYNIFGPLSTKDFMATFRQGGTSLNEVILHFEKKNDAKTGLIITDAASTISYYNPNLFFLTLAGGRLHGSNNNRGSDFASTYYQNGQVACFEAGQFYKPKSPDDHTDYINKVYRRN